MTLASLTSWGFHPIPKFTLTASCSISQGIFVEILTLLSVAWRPCLSHTVEEEPMTPAISCLSCLPIQYQADDVAESFQFRTEPGLLGPHLQQLLYADTGENLLWVITDQLWGPPRPSLFTGWGICYVGFCPHDQKKGCSGMVLISLRITDFFSPVWLQP